MTAKTVVALVSVALTVGATGCLKFYDIGIETPIQAKLDVSSFQRVLILGFLGGGSKDVDPNTETVRLLRSQLRTKSDMRVIDSDVLSLVDEVDRRRIAAAAQEAGFRPCLRCRTPIQMGEIAKRKAWWCPSCQPR